MHCPDKNYLKGSDSKQERSELKPYAARRIREDTKEQGCVGIEGTIQTLNRFVDSSSFNNIAENKRFIVTGYASGPRGVKSNQRLIREAKDMRRQLVVSLKE